MDPAGSTPEVTAVVEVAGLSLTISHPASAEDLIDEEAFARDERLPYWAELWPSAHVLAEALGSRDLRGARVVELGCGLGVPSIVALAGGARVLATDWYPEALAFAHRNAASALGAELPTMLVDWFAPPDELLGLAPFDVVAAADVLYEARNADALAALLPRLAGTCGEVLVADPRRPDAARLWAALDPLGWRRETRDVRLTGRHDEAGPVIHLHRLRPPAQVRARPSDTMARSSGPR